MQHFSLATPVGCEVMDVFHPLHYGTYSRMTAHILCIFVGLHPPFYLSQVS
jgi:hypothetical protein